MSKEIRTIIWCDGPDHDVEDVEAAVTRRFAADTLKECEIDLCESCDKEIVQPLLALLTDHGQPVKGARSIQPALLPDVDAPRTRTAHRLPPEVKCPVEDCDWEGSKPGASQHAPKVHGENITILEGRFGRRLLDGSRITLGHPCPLCDAAYETKGGLTTHKRQTHGGDA
jgi:hypothetical protein